MVEYLRKLRQYLLTGVSYVIPCIACGGILIALSLAFSPMRPGEAPDPTKAPEQLALLGGHLMLPWRAILTTMLEIGGTAFKLAFPILAGFIAYAIAGKPGLVPGFIGGFFAGGFSPTLLYTAEEMSSRGIDPNKPIVAGFLGALLIGLIAGWIVQLLKKMPTPKTIKPIMPILIIPILSSIVVGIVMIKILGIPVASAMQGLGDWLRTMGAGNAVVLAMVLGAMIAFDMGGPVNKAAFFFGAAMIKEQNFAVMGACAAAICTPPLGLGLATLIRRKLWKDEEKEAGIAALAMGMIGITEGAIPFAAGDPLRVIPCIMIGSMVASVIAMLGGVGDHAPHGGPIVLPVVDSRLMYIVAIVAGTIVTAFLINVLKRLSRKPAAETSEVSA